MAVEILERWKKKVQWQGPLPPPLLMARPLRQELFFAASLREFIKYIQTL